MTCTLLNIPSLQSLSALRIHPAWLNTLSTGVVTAIMITHGSITITLQLLPPEVFAITITLQLHQKCIIITITITITTTPLCTYQFMINAWCILLCTYSSNNHTPGYSDQLPAHLPSTHSLYLPTPL